MTTQNKRLALGCVLVLWCVPLLRVAVEAQAKNEARYFVGQVVPNGSQMTLLLADGKSLPIFKDSGSQQFFLDKTLHKRPLRLTALLLPTQMLQVVDVHSYHNGKLHELYYWCDICAIRRNAPGICECCGGPMELREPRAAKGG